MSARTDALMSQQETGKTTAFIIPRYDRLSPGVLRITRQLQEGSLGPAVGFGEWLPRKPAD